MTDEDLVMRSLNTPYFKPPEEAKNIFGEMGIRLRKLKCKEAHVKETEDKVAIVYIFDKDDLTQDTW